QGWHDRSIGHMETVDASHLQAGIDDGPGIGSHSTGADRMIRSLAVSSDVIEKLLIGLDRRTGFALLHDVMAQNWAGSEFSADFEDREHHPSIQFGVEIVRPNDWSFLDVFRFDPD